MSFADMTKIMKDIAGFVQSFVEQLKAFIDGFKNRIDFFPPTGEDDHREDKD